MKTKTRNDRSVMASTFDAHRLRLAAASTHRDTPPAGNSALIAAELVATRCRWCNDDLEHCHDSLVVHAIGEVHCMGANCSTAAELHHMVIDCDDFGCTCAETGTADSGHGAGAGYAAATA